MKRSWPYGQALLHFGLEDDSSQRKKMRTNKKGIEIVKHFEGFRSRPYRCSAGIPTIGYGACYYS